MKKIHFIVLVLGLLAITGCRDPYHMELRSGDQSVLVVEGFLNRGQFSTFQLSRTMNLSDDASQNPELKALVTVESKDNPINAPFTERGNGTYQAYLTFLEVGKEYRLRIRTNNGKEYLSDYIEVKNNPVIDSVSWRQQENDDLQISISTHDPGNNTHYYRWDYDETWEIRSAYFSTWKRVGPDKIIERRIPQEDVSVCWKHNVSTNIILGSSTHLSSDVISENPLILIPRTSEKLSYRYSILVRQYTLTKGAFEYFQLLKKNTESLGSIFGPLPSEIKGNIHCISDPNEQVIGYVTASAVQMQRIFISPINLKGRGFFMLCEPVKIDNKPDSIVAYEGFEPYEAEYTPSGSIKSWNASLYSCVDCTTRGGSTQKPIFW